MRSTRALRFVLALAVSVAFAAMAAAQAPAGYELAGQGRVMARKGNNLIIDVKQGQELGIRKFQITSASKVVFYKEGKAVQVFDLKVGDQVSAYRPTATPASSVTVTEEEVKQMVAEEAPAPAPAPAPKVAAAPATAPAPKVAAAPAPAAEEKPAVLPASGSSMPLLLLLGVGLVAAGAGLTLSRRA